MPRTLITDTAPHDTQAEKTVLGALLLDPNAIYKMSPSLTPNDFYDPVLRDVFATIVAVSEEGSVVDFVTVGSRLLGNKRVDQLGGSAFLAALATDVPTSSHVSQYAAIVRDKSRRRQLARLGRTISDISQDDQRSADELTEQAEQEFLNLSRQDAVNEPSQLETLSSDRYDHYATLYEADDPTAYYGVRTGFASLDDKLTGLAPGQLIVLAGRPGMGKTAFALDIAWNVAVQQQKSVCLISLEMSKEEVFDRLLSKQLAIPSWRLARGDLTEEQFTQMGPTLDRFANHPLFIDDDPCSDLGHLRSKARRQQLQHGLDLLIVDYLQLIEVTDKTVGENQTQRITHISKSLKRLARELDCPVLALSQLSRECERRTDKRPLLSDLRDSGSIEQDGDRILMLYREGEYIEDCDDPDLTDIFLRKNRHGPTGSIELRFDRETMTFQEQSRVVRPITPSAVA